MAQFISPHCLQQLCPLAVFGGSGSVCPLQPLLGAEDPVRPRSQDLLLGTLRWSLECKHLQSVLQMVVRMRVQKTSFLSSPEGEMKGPEGSHGELKH